MSNTRMEEPSKTRVPPIQTSKRRVSDGRPGVRTGMTWPPALPFALVLERARRLDRSALGMLYSRFLPVVYRYTLARVADVHLAEDLTSETFFAVVEQISQTRATDELGFAAWILGIARNKVLMHYRQQRSRPQADEHALALREATGDQGDPLAIITAREQWAEVVGALNRLTEDQRAVLLYHCVLGYSTDEVAHLLEKRPGTIRALQFRALASLARLLGEATGARSNAAARERGSGDAP